VPAQEQVKMAEVRNNWEGRTVNEIFPLRRFLGSSNHSTVFLTESSVEGFLNAAIKLVPVVDPAQNQAQLWQWKTAATFSHPHLMRLLDCGQCDIDGEPLLFVVMEYAEESLSQILPYRSLGPDEVQELLVPTLNALAFLHGEKWIQGQLKPSNFLVVNDQLKLAVDTIRPVGVAQPAVRRRPSIYEPPESDSGNVTPSSDIWALGVTMTEALTQYPPTWLGGRTDPPTFPTNLPPEFADTIQRCFSLNPADRPTVAQLQVRTKPGRAASPAAPQPIVAPVPAAAVIPPLQPPFPQIPDPPSMRAEARGFSEYEESKRSVLIPAVVAVAVVAAAVWGGAKLLQKSSSPVPAIVSDPTSTSGAEADQRTASVQQATEPEGQLARPAPTRAAPPDTRASTTNEPAPSSSAGTPSRTNTPPPSRRQATVIPPPRQDATSPDNSAAAVHEEIPTVSAGSRSTIRGHVRVGVRVTVDSSGRVVRDNLDNPSSSNYFNRVASEAARKWRFAATDQGSREWVLRFEFGRDGTTVRAVGPRS
jgi:eukaryotic-like serine/threonine-protein kinase